MICHVQLSIVLCNSDGIDDTLDCIESIYRHPPIKPFEIILVDNASYDGCVSKVGQLFPAVRVFVASHRQGFSRNYNMGIRASVGRYILVLNNDTIIGEFALQAMLDAMERDPTYGMVGPRLIGANGRIQASCVRSLPTVASYVLHQLLLDSGLPMGRIWENLARWRVSRLPSGAVDCISGACMLVSRQSLTKVGPLDEAYEFYYEDVDWCQRIQRGGFLIGHVAEARVVHLGGQSSMRVKVWARQNEYRGAVRYFQSYAQPRRGTLTLIRWATLSGLLIRGLGFVIAEALSGKSTYARDYLYLWHWLLEQRPEREATL